MLALTYSCFYPLPLDDQDCQDLKVELVGLLLYLMNLFGFQYQPAQQPFSGKKYIYITSLREKLKHKNCINVQNNVTYNFFCSICINWCTIFFGTRLHPHLQSCNCRWFSTILFLRKNLRVFTRHLICICVK